jgi:hypothetical protein
VPILNEINGLTHYPDLLDISTERAVMQRILCDVTYRAQVHTLGYARLNPIKLRLELHIIFSEYPVVLSVGQDFHLT